MVMKMDHICFSLFFLILSLVKILVSECFKESKNIWGASIRWWSERHLKADVNNST